MSDIREKARKVAHLLSQIENLESGAWPTGTPTSNELWELGRVTKIRELEAELIALLSPNIVHWPVTMPCPVSPLPTIPLTTPSPAPFPNYEVTCGAKT